MRHFAYNDHEIIRISLGKILPSDSEFKVASNLSNLLRAMNKIQDQSAKSLKKLGVSCTDPNYL